MVVISLSPARRARGNYPSPVTAPSVHHNKEPSFHLAGGMEPSFAIVASAVFLIHHRSVKDAGDKFEIEPSFPQISGALGFVPLKESRLIHHT
jgi:hypothetical protein